MRRHKFSPIKSVQIGQSDGPKPLWKEPAADIQVLQVGVGAECCSQGPESSSPTTPTAALQASEGEGDGGGGGGCGKQMNLFVIPSSV